MSNLPFGRELARAMNFGAYKNVLNAELSTGQLLAMVLYEPEV